MESYCPDPQQHTTTTPKQSRCEEEAHSPCPGGPDPIMNRGRRTALFLFPFFFIGIFSLGPPCSPQSLFSPPHPSSSSLSCLPLVSSPPKRERRSTYLSLDLLPSSLRPPSHPSFSFPPPPTRSREGPSSPTTYPLGLPPPIALLASFSVPSHQELHFNTSLPLPQVPFVSLNGSYYSRERFASPRLFLSSECASHLDT